MAITKGVNIACSDIQASGGIKNILIRTWAENDTISYSNTDTVHAITSIQHSGANATWFNYEFKNELPVFTASASKENGSTAYECALNFMMPEMDNAKGAAIQSLMDTCMMALAVANNGKVYVLGISQKYSNEKATLRNQTYASMSTAEATSGAAYNDDGGWTVNLSCKQWEAPRLYTGTVNLYTATGKSTTT
jgi:hypothetical protein